MFTGKNASKTKKQITKHLTTCGQSKKKILDRKIFMVTTNNFFCKLLAYKWPV